MNVEKASHELRVIRQLMERPVRYSTQSGLAGILAGTVAIAGCIADWAVCAHFQPRVRFWINLAIWAAVFAVAFAAATLLTRLRERRQAMPFWSSVKKQILLAIAPPFVAGAGLSLAIALRWYYGLGPNMWGLIPPVWMLFYAVALWQVGRFGIVELRVMAAAFLLAGLAVVSLPVLDAHPYLTIAATFGGFHLIYGAIVWARHGG